MKRISKHNGMTLVELILAVVLLNIVVLTGVSMELGMRRIFSSTETEAQLLDEAAPILTMVTKDINFGIGDTIIPSNSPYNNTSLGGGDPTFRIRIDNNNNGMMDAADRWVAYRYVNNATNPHELWRYPDAAVGNYVVLSSKVINFNITVPANGTSDINLQLRKDPAHLRNLTNPEVTLHSEAQYRGFTQI